MRTSIKLILINLILAQIIAPFLIMIPCAIYLFITTGALNQEVLMQTIMIPAQLAGQFMMGIYLWKGGYISRQRITWSPVSGSYLLYGLLAMLSCGYLVSALMEYMTWMPNLMKQSFDILQSGWGGILAIAIIGPLIEEVLFRGAITKALLQQYSPTKAIFISALLFGIFHINPAQILPAFLIGLLFAWTYYKTASLIPCILMHILNNALSVYLNFKYPGVENISDLISGTPYIVVGLCSIAIFVVAILLMRKTTVHYPWRKEEEKQDSTT